MQECAVHTNIWYRTQVTYFFLQNCRIGSPQIHAWQSAVIREASADTSQTPHEESVTPHEDSANTSQRVCGIAEKDLQIKCRKFERLAS